MAKKKPRFSLPSRAELFLLLFSLIFGFILCEVGARIWLKNIASDPDVKKFGLYKDVKPEAWRIQPHHYLNYTLTPNYQRDKLSHNALGYRGKEISLPKPADTYRIATIGGSTTYTEFVLDNEATYPALLEKVLQEDYAIKNVEVINAGVPGYTTWESLINLQFRVLDLNPDLIIIYHGTNDVHTRLIPSKDYRGDNAGKRKPWELPEISFWDKSVVLRIIRRKMGWSNQVWLQDVVSRNNYIAEYERKGALEKNPPIYFERNLRNMVATAQANNVEVLLATWAHSPQFDDYASSKAYQIGFQEHNESIKKVGHEMSAAVFDFAEIMSQDKKYWHDGRHVNKEGAELKATLFGKYLIEHFTLSQQIELE